MPATPPTHPVDSAHASSNRTYPRSWFISQFREIVTGWYGVLRTTSDSGAVWESPDGIRLQNFVSRSGKQCDGVIRMLPALAAWASQTENPPVLQLDGDLTLDARAVILAALRHGTDPEHPDYWGEPPEDRPNQRQVEASLVAWVLWLSRSWLLEQLGEEGCRNVQQWLASCTRFTEFSNNWSLFIAVNHAARIALAEHGFAGDPAVVREQLLQSDTVALQDGWLWDSPGHGIDYYNYWVYGSHHLYLAAMLPELAEKDPVLRRNLRAFATREKALPYLIDREGRHVLFGRSLSYRWGWLNGTMVAQFLKRSSLAPETARRMFGTNLQWWLSLNTLTPGGVLRERLTEQGSDGARDGYINCGHPYWGMQAFLCLALAPGHPFWSEAPRNSGKGRARFIPLQGPGMALQRLSANSEARLFNLRNLAQSNNALYAKFVYSSAFPVNAIGPKHEPLPDNQLTLLLPDGNRIGATGVVRCVVRPDGSMEVALQYTGVGVSALVLTSIRCTGPAYSTRHRIDLREAPEGAIWEEGGFNLGLPSLDSFTLNRQENSLLALRKNPFSVIATTLREGWKELLPRMHPNPEGGESPLPSTQSSPHILEAAAVYMVLRAPIQQGRCVLEAVHHAASAENS